jgi:Rrf2 family protein
MLQSLRGKNGGYKLARQPEEYTINEILLLTEGTLAPVNCIMQDGVQCEKAATCSTLPLWAGLDSVIEKYLSKITLRDIIDGNRKKMLGDYCSGCDTE